MADILFIENRYELFEIATQITQELCIYMQKLGIISEYYIENEKICLQLGNEKNRKNTIESKNKFCIVLSSETVICDQNYYLSSQEVFGISKNIIAVIVVDNNSSAKKDHFHFSPLCYIHYWNKNNYIQFIHYLAKWYSR